MTLNIKLKHQNQHRLISSDFVHSVARIFNGYKLANNGFIGLLAKNYITNHKHYFTTDRTRALK